MDKALALQARGIEFKSQVSMQNLVMVATPKLGGSRPGGGGLGVC